MEPHAESIVNQIHDISKRKNNPSESVASELNQLLNGKDKKYGRIQDFSDAKFIHLNLSGVNELKLRDLSGAKLVDCDLSNSEFRNATLTGAKFISNEEKIKSRSCGFSETKSEGLVLKGFYVGANFGRANLRRSDLSGCNLEDANFDFADLKGANLLDIRVNSNTSFKVVKSAKGCKINRSTLHHLKDYGGLTVGNRMEMIIVDDVALLKTQFSGYKKPIYFISMLCFFFPYVWFIVKQWKVARFNIQVGDGTHTSIALWEAFLRFIYSGGENWKEGWHFEWSFITFVFVLLYNGLRGYLFSKTNMLEANESASGLPANFTLSEKTLWWFTWGKLLAILKVAFWVYLLLVCINTIHFLNQEILIPKKMG